MRISIFSCKHFYFPSKINSDLTGFKSTSRKKEKKNGSIFELKYKPFPAHFETVSVAPRLRFFLLTKISDTFSTEFTILGQTRKFTGKSYTPRQESKPLLLLIHFSGEITTEKQRQLRKVATADPAVRAVLQVKILEEMNLKACLILSFRFSSL